MHARAGERRQPKRDGRLVFHFAAHADDCLSRAAENLLGAEPRANFRRELVEVGRLVLRGKDERQIGPRAQGLGGPLARIGRRFGDVSFGGKGGGEGHCLPAVFRCHGCIFADGSVVVH